MAATTCRELGLDVTWGEVRQGHTWTCWRDLLDPHLTDLLRKVWTLMRARARGSSTIPGFDRPGTVIRYGHYGRPVAGVPERAGPGLGLREQRHGRARSRTWSRPAGSSSTASTRSTTSPGRTGGVPLEERARRHRGYEAWITDQVVPLIDQRLARRTATSSRPAAASAPTTRCNSRSPAPTCSRWRSASPATTTRRQWHAWGERGDAAYFTNPTDYVPHLHGDHLDWLRSRRPRRARPSARARGRPTPPARCRRRGGWPALLADKRHPARARRLGPRLGPRLAVVAAPDRPPPAPVLLTVG